MTYHYNGKAYETIKELAEEYGWIVRKIILFDAELVVRKCNAHKSEKACY